MASEMERRVAAALTSPEIPDNPITYLRVPGSPGFPTYFEAMTETIVIALARAAIAAMREPTSAMVQAAEDGDDPGSDIYGERAVALSHGQAWRAMIDAALEEPDGPQD